MPSVPGPALLILQSFDLRPRADTAITFANPPAASPLPSFRKLGNHHKLVKSSTDAAPAPGLSQHQEDEKKAKEVGSSDEHDRISQAQYIQIEKKHHDSIDKSICGGVILGGLATAFLLAIVCYIRATRRKHTMPSAPAA
ncbi:hypothetical protein K7X08_007157 [Anisodus acutangulus]|uniref:Uncharacterized protein n=1 Tax=Anisodus acutangulus TaxID=402998 RepID=A0A9Q1LF95_9SOLA|nr:hypothetical protein K7X08_007157 [Anisodus acutangulus]